MAPDHPKIKSVTVNGGSVKVESPDAAVLLYEELPGQAKIEIVTEGGWGEGPAGPGAPSVHDAAPAAVPQAELPQALKKAFAVLTAMQRLVAQEPGADYERAFIRESLGAIEAWRARSAIVMPGFFRPITPQRRTGILKFYENAALGMYNGLARRMAAYAQSPDPAKKRIADLFQQARDSEKPSP